jgi:hypothetical protein
LAEAAQFGLTALNDPFGGPLNLPVEAVAQMLVEHSSRRRAVELSEAIYDYGCLAYSDSSVLKMFRRASGSASV